MKMSIFTADCIGQPANCYYPKKVVVDTPEQVKEAMKMDHVCAEYKGNYRSVDNFIRSDVIVMDIDNDHSEDSAEWITPEKLEKMFPDMKYVLVSSRHHMLKKENKSARPRYHIYLSISEINDAKEYANMKKALQKKYPFFDGNALDAARFIFGSDCTEVVVHNGQKTLDEEINTDQFTEDEDFDSENTYIPSGEQIHEGNRNNAMSRYALCVLKRYGDTEQAHEKYVEYSKKCTPPLEDSELKSIWNSKKRFFYKNIANRGDYIPPDVFNTNFKAGSLRPDDFSDMGQAKILVREYGDKLKYTSATGFLVFNGKYWSEDSQGGIATVEELLDRQLIDARFEQEIAKKHLMDIGIQEEFIKENFKNVLKSADEKHIPLIQHWASTNSYLNFVCKKRDFKHISAIANTVKPMLAIPVDDMDKNGYLINTPSATYDLRQGLAGKQPHNPKDLITKITACSPGKDGEQIWQDALNIFFCSNQELIDYVQEIVGMVAVGKVYQEFMIIAHGRGANGKSTFFNALFRVLGNYAGKISPEILTRSCKRNAKPEIAELKGKRFIIASEMREGMDLDTAMVKQLCSTDEIQAEKKYKDPFSFTPSHTLVLYTNYLPQIGNADDGIWRRLVLIPFSAKITGKSDIKNYADFLFEHAGPAIMSWVIEGAQKIIDKRFQTTPPQGVKDAIQAYREDNDWLAYFLDDCCDKDPFYYERSGPLYNAYREYCTQNGISIHSTTDFHSALGKKGYKKYRKNTGVLVKGLKLKDQQSFLQSGNFTVE